MFSDFNSDKEMTSGGIYRPSAYSLGKAGLTARSRAVNPTLIMIYNGKIYNISLGLAAVCLASRSISKP